jgi:hypothetical protein
MGLNASGWPIHRRRDKTLHAHHLLQEFSPDILVALETAHLPSDSLLSCHDNYSALSNAANSDDARHALGHGIAIIYRDSLSVCRLLTPANTDRLVIARV